MTLDKPYYSVSELCLAHQLTKNDFMDIFLTENLKLCIYLSNLKTYYFDLTVCNSEINEYKVQSRLMSGLFYLTSYEACKVLCKGESLISCIQPQGNAFITLSEPRKILFSDLLIDVNGFDTFDKLCCGITSTVSNQPALSV